MAATIRLQRTGRKKQASFRIVVMDAAESPTGPSLHTLGTYNPRTKPSLVELDTAAALDWLHEGAQVSDTVRSIFRKTGVWQKFQDGVTSEAVEDSHVTLGPPLGERKTSRRAEVALAAASAQAKEKAEKPAAAPAEKLEAEAEEVASEADAAEAPEAEADAPEAEEAPEDAPDSEAEEASEAEAETDDAAEAPKAEVEEAPEAEEAPEDAPDSEAEEASEAEAETDDAAEAPKAEVE
ncbi:MAG: 30S ribosomal protein S16, partial [Gemmatimonadota bacterium]